MGPLFSVAERAARGRCTFSTWPACSVKNSTPALKPSRARLFTEARSALGRDRLPHGEGNPEAYLPIARPERLGCTAWILSDLPVAPQACERLRLTGGVCGQAALTSRFPIPHRPVGLVMATHHTRHRVAAASAGVRARAAPNTAPPLPPWAPGGGGFASRITGGSEPGGTGGGSGSVPTSAAVAHPG